MKMDEVKRALSASVLVTSARLSYAQKNAWEDIVAARSQIEALLLEKAALRRAIEDRKEGAATEVTYLQRAQEQC